NAIGSEFLINSSTDGNQNESDSSALALLGIDENSGAGQVVYTATATDTGDISDGVTFSLSGDDAALFSINSSTGDVTLLADPDYETQSSYSFTVTASDGAGNHTDQAVTLDVNDLDEIAPTASLILSMATEEVTASIDKDNLSPQLTALGNSGGYALVWYGSDGEGDNTIFARSYDNQGQPVGYLISLEATDVSHGEDVDPQIIAIDDSGRFAVTWQGDNGSGTSSIYVQQFEADGSLSGSTVELDAVTGQSEFTPQITALASGDYVVTWYDTTDVYVQAFNADGSLKGTLTTLSGSWVSLPPQISTSADDGSYVVVWSSFDSSFDLTVFVQRFNADGSPNGSPLSLEATGVSDGNDGSAVAMAFESGGFVVAWAGDDGLGLSIYVQTIAADGSLIGSAVKLDAPGYPEGEDVQPALALLGDTGAYVVTWRGTDAEGDTSIFVQLFNADGSLAGDIVTLEATGNTTGNDTYSEVAAFGDSGAWAIVWQGEDEQGDQSVFVQRFNADGSLNGTAITLESPDNSSGDDRLPQIVATGSDGAFIVTWYGIGTDGYYQVYSQRFDANGSAVEVATESYSLGDMVSLYSNEAGSVYLVSSSISVNDISDILTADSSLWVSSSLAAAGSTEVNTSGLQLGDYYAYAVDEAGNISLASARYITIADMTAPTFTSSAAGYVVSWTTADDSDGSGIVGQRYDANGQTLGDEFQINTTLAGDQSESSVTTLLDGSFIVVWTTADDGDGSGIVSQRFSASGERIGSETVINSTTTGSQSAAQVEALGSGGYVVVWTSN
ncbi:cadherin repeat domain-containing protein, partial [Oceanobacter sp. 3_MG-2023]|uniref:cadherin repeat domain-containing protein n=1 Tax=Oceanobacter sp. 3_MG-2023 TaxID=3062622 RepID=UPI0027336984